jgi:hypothetical protein
MASTYSTNLKVELIGTGDQAGTWGVTANGNMGTVLEEAIVGKGTVSFSGSNSVSALIGNGPATSAARCIYLSVGGTLTGTGTLTVSSVKKTYIIENATSGGYSITVTTGSGTTVTVLHNKRALIYVDGGVGGTGVVQQFNDIDATTTIGGLAFATVTGAQTLTNKTLTGPAINGGTVAQTVLTYPSLIEFGGAPYKSGSGVTGLDNPISTDGTTTVTVAIPSNGAAIGDYLVMAGASSVGGIPAYEFNRVNVITAVATNSVSFVADTAGTAAAGGGVDISYALLPKITPPSSPTTLIGASETVTLTNKRITARITTNGSTYSGNLTPISYSTDQYTVTGLNGATTFLAPSAVGGDAPTQGQKLIIRIKDAGVRRTSTVPTNGISVTSGSTSVTITDNSNGASAGDYVTISGVASAIGGISAGTLNNRFIIDSASTNTISITVPTAATSTATGGTGAGLSYDGLKLTWTTTSGGYRVIGTSLPTATTAGKTIYVGCIYNSTDTYWDVVAVTTQA